MYFTSHPKPTTGLWTVCAANIAIFYITTKQHINFFDLIHCIVGACFLMCPLSPIPNGEADYDYSVSKANTWLG